MTQELHRDIVQNLPHLRAFALLLTRDRTLADDLVQETVLRAITYGKQFMPGTNFKAWITTILRNCYFNEIRHRGRLSQFGAAMPSEEPTTSGGQEEHLEVRDFQRAFRQLADTQREALVLVGASGFSYEEAARVVGCAVGTMKSRVSRARLQVQKMLDDGAPLAVDQSNAAEARAKNGREPSGKVARPIDRNERRQVHAEAAFSKSGIY